MSNLQRNREAGGLGRIADKATDCVPPPRDTTSKSGGQTSSANTAQRKVPSSCAPDTEHREAEGRKVSAAKARSGMPTPRDADLDTTIATIRSKHRERVYAMEQRKRADLSLLAFLRMALGWSKALPDAERGMIALQAKALVTLGEAAAKGKATDIDEPIYLEYKPIIVASIMARAPFDQVEKAATKEMERLAKTLPVWAWGEPIRGFGPVSLAVIVGEAGNLSDYPKKGHLWKRMGVAVMGDGSGHGDVRQGGLTKSASKADWIAHGYSAVRRSRVWNIGDALIKNGEAYRAVYLARKDYERTKAEAAGLTVAPAAKIPKARASEFMSDGHVHKRAQRYMEKMLLRDLLSAWKATA